MRVCIVNEFFYPDNAGGTGTVLSDLVRSLRELYTDVEIDVVTSKNLYRQATAALPAFEDWNGVRIHRLATPRPNGLPTPLRLGANLLFCAGALLKLLTLRRYDVVLLATAPPMTAISGQVLKQLKGTPYVYIVYDLEPDRSVAMKVLPQKHPVAALFHHGQKRWLKSASKVVVLGHYMGKHLHKTYGLPMQNIEVIPIGSNPKEIVPGPKDTRFRAQNGLAGFVVLYSGNFGRYHNFDTLLDAALSLRETRPDIQFVLVGDGAQKAHITRRVTDEAISNVRLFDFVAKEDYADLLASADISLVTLEPGMEGLCVPSKFYSILASGRPVLATVPPQSEVARVIDEAQAGVHMALSETDRLASTLTELADNAAKTEQMGRNARTVLEEKYSMTRIAHQYYAVLQSVASGQRLAPASLWSTSRRRPSRRSSSLSQVETPVEK